MIPSLTLIVVGANTEDLDAWKAIADPKTMPENIYTILYSNTMRKGYGQIGQAFWENCETDVFGICHADTKFPPGSLAPFIELAQQNVVCGLVGRKLSGQYIWSKDQTEPTPVSTLDSSSLFMPISIRMMVNFDIETFDSFHCCVEDVCILAASLGIRVMVPASPADHAGQSTNEAYWQNAYAFYRDKLSNKWRGHNFITT